MAAADYAQWMRRFLDGETDIPDGLPSSLVEVLVKTLVDRRDASGLALLLESPQRDVSKQARRGLHLLRSRGVATPEPKPHAPVRITAPKEEAEAWTDVPGGDGKRLVVIVRPGSEFFQLMLSDEQGLVSIAAGEGSRRKWRQVRKELEADGYSLATVSLEYALWLIQEAYELTLSIGRSPPPEFAAARARFGSAPRRFPEHPALHGVPIGVAADASLHGLRELAVWGPPREVLDKLRLEIDEAHASQLVVGEAQRHQAIGFAIDRAIEVTFAPELRPRWRKRCLDAAYVYSLSGKPEVASRLRNAAEKFAFPSYSPTADVFARAFVEKLLPGDLTRGGGLIVPDSETKPEASLIIPT